MYKILKTIISTAVVLAGLFFGIIGIIALATHQDYVVVLNLAFAWIKGLSKG